MVKENVDVSRLLQLVEHVGKSASFYTMQAPVPAFPNTAFLFFGRIFMKNAGASYKA